MSIWSSTQFRSGLFAASALCAAAVSGVAWAQAKTFEVPAQPAATGVAALARQSDVQILISAADASGKRVNEVRGSFPVAEALDRLLAGSGLTAQLTGAQTYTVIKLPQRQEAQLGPPRGDAVEEVIVSARRRDERLQDVPISLAVKSGGELQKAGVSAPVDLTRVVPNFMLPSFAFYQTPSAYIRGIGTPSNSIGVDSSVGIAVDGVVSGHTSALSGDFSDIERVEVLRGPQGTLFGKNATAGLVNIVTKDPTEEFSGNFTIATGSYNQLKALGTMSGPVTDRLTARISVLANKRDGYLYDLNTKRNVNYDDQKAVRAIFVYKPSDATRLRLSVEASDRKNDWGNILPFAALGPLSPASDLLESSIAGPTNNRLWTSGTPKVSNRTKTHGATLQWDQDIGDYRLTSISAYQAWDWNWKIEDEGTTPAPYPIAKRALDYLSTDQWSQELRLASPSGRRLEYVAGLYLYHQRYASILDRLNIVNPTLTQFVYSYSKVTTLNYAAFGEANFHATDKLTLTAGLRETHEKKDIVVIAQPAPPGTSPFLQSVSPGTKSDSVTASNLSWRLGANWKLTADHMFYASVSRGFKGPGFNYLSAIANYAEPVKPEVATAYEAGLKSEWLERRLLLNLALFRENITDAQVTQSRPTVLPDGNVTLAYVLSNAARVRTQGVEAELTVRPTAGLIFNLAGAVADAKYVAFVGAPCWVGQTPATGCLSASPGAPASQDLSGQPLFGIPKYTWNAAASYDVPLPSLPVDGTVRLDYAWRSKNPWVGIYAPNGTEGAFGLLNASIALHDRARRFEIVGQVKNLTNQFFTAGKGGGLGTITQVLTADHKRTWELSLNYKF